MSAGDRMDPLPGPAGPGAGFTLVELLVALTLFAIMSVLLFSGLRFGVRAWEVGGDRIERLALVESVQNLLRRQLSQASLPYIPVDVRARAPVSGFIGTSDAVRFIARLPAHRGSGGLYVFLLSAKHTGTRAELRLSWQTFLPDALSPESFEPEDERSLLDGVADFQFAYYGSYDPARAPQWNETWDGILGLPDLIRIRVTFPPGDIRRWPDLVVAPRLSPAEEF